MNIVCITTYKRPQLLIKVLQTIPKEFEVLIFQDGCNGDYSECKTYLKQYKHSWYNYKTPHGKPLFWALWRDMFNILKEKKFDLVHFLADDTIPNEDYWNLISIIFATKDIEVVNAFCVEAHRRMYYRKTPIMDFGRYKVFSVDKVDCAFICNIKFFERLNWEVLPVPTDFDFSCGSGVGYYMSQRYLHAGGVTCNVYPSLLIHEGVESVIGNKIAFPVVTSITDNQEEKIKYPEKILREQNKINSYSNGRVIWSLDSSYAGVSFIANYLNAKIIMYNKRRKDFDAMFYDFKTYVDNKDEVLKELKEAKKLLLFGAKGVQYLLPILDSINKKLSDYKVTFLITDHWYFKDKFLNKDRINIELKKCKDVKYLFMPDCLGYKPDFIKDYSLYYQYLPVPSIEIIKEKTIAHSPGLKVDTNEKGTDVIRKVCKEVDFKLDVIAGEKWENCIKRKAKAMIFIDQIIGKERAKQMKIDNYSGGIGKSGLEAMKLGCVVLTSGELIGDKTLPKAPIILTDETGLASELQKLKKLPLKKLKEIGKKNKEWADKYTGFDFVLNNIDSNIERIEQMAISCTLLGFEKRMQDKFKLSKYEDETKATLFFGLYRKEDYERVKEHKGKGVILFAGTDVDYFGNCYKNYINDLLRFRIIAISQNVKDRLFAYGLDSEFIPICPAPIIKNVLPKKNAKCVYFYGKGVKYGEELIPEIQKQIPFKIIKTTNGQFSAKEINNIYKKCFIGLRLTPKDGLSNTVIEMGLAGRRVVYNSNPLPNAIRYENVNNIVNAINNEYKRREEDCNPIADEMFNYMNKFNDFWLYV